MIDNTETFCRRLRATPVGLQGKDKQLCVHLFVFGLGGEMWVTSCSTLLRSWLILMKKLQKIEGDYKIKCEKNPLLGGGKECPNQYDF